MRLLSKGYSVKIYEKEQRLGGKVNLIETDDFRFDLTASILMTPKIYHEVFEYAGKNYQDYLEFLRVDPIYRANYSDGSRIDFSSDLTKLSNSLERISIEDYHGYLKFLTDVYKKYQIANKYFLQKSFIRAIDFFNPKTLSQALRLNTFSTSSKFISKYINSKKLQAYLAFQSLYVGISPFNGPNIYTLVPTISQIYGLWHIKGGMYSYIKALEKLILELGGTIETGVNVEEILISKGKAVGVKTNSKEEYGDIIICNADFPYAMNELIKDNQYKGKYTPKKIAKKKHSCSTFIMYLGLKKKYPQLHVHNMYFGDNFKENIECVFKGKLPSRPSFYIYSPSSIDETMSKKGYECLSIVVRVPNLLFDNVVWNEKTIHTMRKKVMDSIQKIRGLENLEENIVYESYLTPKDLLDRFNSYGGTAFGLSHTLTQTNYFRPHIKSPTVKNLYFVGSSIHPGTGVSIVLLGSKLVTEEVLKDTNNDFS